MPEINWYPGHMAKSKRLLLDQIKAVDAVIELCDARAPVSTRNPDLIQMGRGKARILVLNKADLADENRTRAWLAHYEQAGLPALSFNAGTGKPAPLFKRIEEATKASVERMRARGVNKTVRVMVIGIPNVGKSTFINRLCGTKSAKAEDRPGVTRASQWVKVTPYLELLDTPGMLWPKLANPHVARNLAFLGSIRDQVLDQEALAGQLLEKLMTIAPARAAERFKLEAIPPETPGHELLDAACKGRGWILSGGRMDTARGAALVLDEFRAGKAGRFTLESPPKQP